MLTVQQIITQADILSPNGVSVNDKLLQLTEFNRSFFDLVKIPKLTEFTTSASSMAQLPSDVREKNIDYVQVGVLRYTSLDGDSVEPLRNVYSYNDVTRALTMRPAPYLPGLQGVVRYYRIGTAVFTSSNMSATPEVPEEYQASFIPALASYLAAAEDDMTKAAKYESQYLAIWNAAAQSYAGGRSS